MTDTRGQLKTLLDDMQSELQTLGLWEGHPPEPEAFESSTPFFADRMDFSQWLQWVFIARFRASATGAVRRGPHGRGSPQGVPPGHR